VLFGLQPGGRCRGDVLLLTGLGQFGHGTLASVTVMPLWGLAGIAGCLAWLWLSAGLLQGRAGCRCRLWWWMLLAAVCRLAPLGLALWWGIAVHAEGIGLLLLGPSMLVPAAMLVWIKRRA
jgi:sugar phosphate permease